MPEALITFDDGSVVRLQVVSFTTENDVSHIEAMDGSRARIRRGRQGVTMSIEGVIVATAYREDFATSELVTPTRSTSRVERSRAALFQPLTRLPAAEPNPRPPKKPKPQSAWDRLLADKILEEAV